MKKLLRTIKSSPLYIACFVVSIWLVTFHLAEYLLTEHWYVYDRLNSAQASIWLVILVLVGLFISYKFKLTQQKVSSKSFVIAMLVLICTLFATSKYQKYYSWLQRFPKIKKLSRNWSIQGDRITIEGKNFGPAWQIGQVRVDDLEFNIRTWSETKIVAEQPLTQDYKVDKLIIKNHYGNEAVVEPFELKDPADVL